MQKDTNGHISSGNTNYNNGEETEPADQGDADGLSSDGIESIIHECDSIVSDAESVLERQSEDHFREISNRIDSIYQQVTEVNQNIEKKVESLRSDLAEVTGLSEKFDQFLEQSSNNIENARQFASELQQHPEQIQARVNEQLSDLASDLIIRSENARTLSDVQNIVEEYEEDTEELNRLDNAVNEERAQRRTITERLNKWIERQGEKYQNYAAFVTLVFILVKEIIKLTKKKNSIPALADSNTNPILDKEVYSYQVDRIKELANDNKTTYARISDEFRILELLDYYAPKYNWEEGEFDKLIEQLSSKKDYYQDVAKLITNYQDKGLDSNRLPGRTLKYLFLKSTR